MGSGQERPKTGFASLSLSRELESLLLMPHSGRLLPEVAFLCHRLHVVPLGEAPCQVWVLLLHEDLLTPVSIDRGRCSLL